MTSTAQEAAEIIKARNTLGFIDAAIILGRNFYSVAELADNVVVIPYADLPGFPRTTATPDGQLLIGTIEGTPTIILKGRVNFHETGDPSQMAGPIETLSLLGVRNILSVAFATSANANLMPSCLVAISDHIDFKGLNPLIGAPGDSNGVNMNDAYDKRLMRRIKVSATAAGVSVHEGVLAWFSGPSFETPAEVKAAKILGADILSVSVAPEAILARRYGMLFAAVAVVTDFGAGFSGGAPNGDFARGPAVAGLMALKRLVRAYLKNR
ncbi:MAG: purine-nucleoside phosphorylase [Methylocystis sp.]